MENKKKEIDELVIKLAKKFNGDNVNVESCLYTGKKPYKKTEYTTLK